MLDNTNQFNPQEDSDTNAQIIEHDENEFSSEIDPKLISDVNNEYKQKTRRLQSDKYRAIQEAQEWATAAHYWKGEAERLQSYASQSSDAALAQMDQNVTNILEQAKENKKRALEEGDTDAAIQADLDMSRAMAKMETLDNYYRERDLERQRYQAAIQQQHQQQQYPQDYSYGVPQAQEVEVPIEAEYLVKTNPWMDPRRSEYNPEKVNALYTFTRELDENLARQGRQEEYFSPAYLNEVNKFIRNNLSDTESRSESSSQRNSYYNNVSPVSRNNGISQGHKQKERYVLTEDEKFMAKNAGLREEDWLKYKIEDIKSGKSRRNNYGQ